VIKVGAINFISLALYINHWLTSSIPSPKEASFTIPDQFRYGDTHASSQRHVTDIDLIYVHIYETNCRFSYIS
jgi:hypothetical protein